MRINKEKKIFVAGHAGLVGTALTNALEFSGYSNIIKVTKDNLNLLKQNDTYSFFKSQKPEYVIMAAAKVGGIHANNTLPAQFLYQNILMEANVIHFSYKFNVKKLIFLGSACIYPKNTVQPIKEDSLLSGKLEPTNEAYAVAKIAGIKLCEAYYKQYKCNFLSLMPNNLYGPYDNFNLRSSHVIPALMRKMHEAKINGNNFVNIWGTGKPIREFLHVDDLARAITFVLEKINAKDIYECGISHINVGSGKEVSIGDLALLIKDIVGYKGRLVFDDSKPDGMKRKLLDSSFINDKGWKANIDIREGLINLYDWYVRNQKR